VKVGDLVRVRTDWGGNGTVGLITKIYESLIQRADKKTQVVTLHTGWEYHTHELEVVSENR